jgi:glycosyltransferase involved in cell wall biosynthesis
MAELSIVIPARNEEWLSRTVEDIISHIEADTEVIVVLDGAPANPPVMKHPRVKVIELPESIGQRGATNLAVKMSSAKYIMKIDAHCAVDQGFEPEEVTKSILDNYDCWW